jgi:hypothetical protein
LKGVLKAAVAAALALTLITPAQARSSHSYSGRSTHEFRTFSCKSSSCFAKHPGGTWCIR